MLFPFNEWFEHVISVFMNGLNMLFPFYEWVVISVFMNGLNMLFPFL